MTREDDSKKTEQKSTEPTPKKSALAEAEAKAEEKLMAGALATTREVDFKRKLVEQLMHVYRDARQLSPEGSDDKSWTETIKQYVKDAAKVIGPAVVASGMGALATYVVGKPDIAGRVAAGVGTIAALCALWSVSNEHEARETAKCFLALVKDEESSEQKGKGENSERIVFNRMTEIADQLCSRFRFSIQMLRNSEDGTEQLATFLSVAMARDFPKLPEIDQIRKGLLPTDEVIKLAVNASIPSSKDDPLYKGWFTNKKLETADDTYNWTVPGLLLRSPIFVNRQRFYVRDGNLSEENRADKYPPQIVDAVKPLRYVMAMIEDLNSIEEFIEINKRNWSDDGLLASMIKVLNEQRNKHMILKERNPVLYNINMSRTDNNYSNSSKCSRCCSVRCSCLKPCCPCFFKLPDLKSTLETQPLVASSTNHP